MKFLKKTKVFAIIFYVLAAIFCLYTIFSIVTTITYLSSVASSGMYMDVGFSDMLNAFLSTVGPNLFYTMVYFFCGYMIQLVSGDIIPEDQEFEEHVETPKSTEAVESTSNEPEATLSYDESETLGNEEPVVLSVDEVQDEESSEVENVVATIADIENEAEIEAPDEELLLEEGPQEDIEELEEKIAEEIDLVEPENKELEELETENEEDE